jgi:plasmid maintenance system antidote protein VapI
MGEYFTKRPLNRPPIHPGEILREDVLPALGLSVSEAARRLGIQHLNHGMKMDGNYLLAHGADIAPETLYEKIDCQQGCAPDRR